MTQYDNSSERNTIPRPEYPRPEYPRPEYPRPDRDRSDRWVNLNGVWEFEGDCDATAITVPFAWETEASGVGVSWMDRGLYRRELAVPADWGGYRPFLNFGAVHEEATVLIDGKEIGKHVGGSTPFEFDITDYLKPGETGVLEVKVKAPTDKREIPHGKQRSIPRADFDGVAFTPTSGIWQTVWLEARGEAYADSVELRGDSLTGIDVVVKTSGGAENVTVSFEGSNESSQLKATSQGGLDRKTVG